MNGFSQYISLLSYLGAGIGLGLLYFHGLWWNIRQFAGGGRIRISLLLGIGRFLLLGLGLLLVAFAGALPLLAASLGVFAARAIAVRHVRRMAHACPPTRRMAP